MDGEMTLEMLKDCVDMGIRILFFLFLKEAEGKGRQVRQRKSRLYLILTTALRKLIEICDFCDIISYAMCWLTLDDAR